MNSCLFRVALIGLGLMAAQAQFGKGRYRAALLRCSPLLLLFLLAWSSGELIGYLRGRGKAPR